LLGFEKFCLDFEILYEYISTKIGFNIFIVKLKF
jgi:hypothetical protein